MDNERTVSVLTRYTLSWVGPLISRAVHRGGLDFNDLSILQTRYRTIALVQRFHKEAETSPLWQGILRVHRETFAYQWLLTFLLSFAYLAPQYFLWRLIMILERDAVHPPPQAAFWMTLLGLAPLLQNWIETWVLWLGWCHIALPVSVQLSGLVVEKSLRKKNVKHVKDSVDDENGGANGVEELGANNDPVSKKLKSGDEPKSKGDDSLTPKRMQDQVNLISIDARRVSDFLSYNPMFVYLDSKIKDSDLLTLMSQDSGHCLQRFGLFHLPPVFYQVSIYSYSLFVERL